MFVVPGVSDFAVGRSCFGFDFVLWVGFAVTFLWLAFGVWCCLVVAWFLLFGVTCLMLPR